MSHLGTRQKLRYKIAFVREYLRYFFFHRERRDPFLKVRRDVRNRRVFVVGNGPSLSHMNLDHLLDEDYFLCNHAECIEWTQGKIHPYYIATDARVPEKFPKGSPELVSRVYFLDAVLKPLLSKPFIQQANIVWFPRAKGGAARRGISSMPWAGVAGGHTVLLSAAQIALFLGYREIYILGCDLNYQAPQAYAYRTEGDGDKKTVRDDEMMIANTNAGFAQLRSEAENIGVLVANAGIGGNLKCLPRVDFDSLFDG